GTSRNCLRILRAGGRAVAKSWGEATKSSGPLSGRVPVDDGLAGYPQQLRNLIDIFAVVEYVDFYRACFRGSCGVRRESLEKLCSIARRVRSFKSQQHGGSCSDAIYLAFQRLGFECCVIVHDLAEPVEVHEQRAGSNRMDLH